MELRFEESTDDGGSRISSYELWWSSDYQAATPTFNKVAGYTNNQMGYTVTSTGDGLVSGESYSFRLKAVNSKGASEYSAELIAAAAAPIAKPAAPTRSIPLSTASSLHIEWAESSATEAPVEGYLLYMAEGYAGDFQVVYNGTLNAL